MRKVWDAKTKKIIKVEDEPKEVAKKSETEETEEETKKGSRKK